MSIAAVGPVSAAVEALASAVAAGGVLGSFLLGIVGFIAGRPREELAVRALTDGYAGGAFGAGAVLLDLILGKV